MLFEGINPRQTLESLQPVIDQETLKNYKPSARGHGKPSLIGLFTAPGGSHTAGGHIQLWPLTAGALAWLNAAKAWALFMSAII